MTPLTILGALFVIVGVVIKALAAAGFLGTGEVGWIAEISNLGMLLLGKELWPGSPDSLAVRKRSIPPVALLVVPFLLLGCAGTNYAPGDAALAARDMRSDLARVSGVLEFARNATPLLCSLQPGPACDALRDSIPVLDAAHKTASQAVDLLEASGLAVDAVAVQVRVVLDQSQALAQTVAALGHEVANAVARPADQPGGPPAQPPTAEAPPASSAAPASP